VNDSKLALFGALNEWTDSKALFAPSLKPGDKVSITASHNSVPNPAMLATLIYYDEYGSEKKLL